MKKETILIYWFFLYLLFLTAACVSKGEPTIPAVTELQAKETQQIPINGKEAWETKWEKTVELAKKEGKLAIVGSAAPQVEAVITKAFENKFGIKIEMTSGPGSQMSQRILTEQRARLFLFDIQRGGLVRFITDLKPANALEQMDKYIVLPEVADPKVWWEGRLPWFEKEHITFPFIASPQHITIVVNTTLVKPEEIKSFWDMLNPKWKGKIIMLDPSYIGTTSAWFQRAMKSEKFGIDYMRQLAKQEPIIVRDNRFILEKVSKGAYPLSIGALTDVIIIFMQAGAPIMEIDTNELLYITPSSGSLGILRNPPHSNAATVFLNWLLSREGQTLYSKAMGQQSARIDIPTNHLLPEDIRVPGLNYLKESEEDILERPKYMNLAGEIFQIGK